MMQSSLFLDIDNSWTQIDPHQRAAIGLDTHGYDQMTRLGLLRPHTKPKARELASVIPTRTLVAA
jgi:hypothetical protein